MDRKTRNYLRQRSAHTGKVEIKRDTLVAVLGGLVGYLAPERFTKLHPVAFTVASAIGAVVLFEVWAFVWRFAWTAPKRMHDDDQKVIVRLESERNEAWQRRDEALNRAETFRAVEQERDDLTAHVDALQDQLKPRLEVLDNEPACYQRDNAPVRGVYELRRIVIRNSGGKSIEGIRVSVIDVRNESGEPLHAPVHSWLPLPLIPQHHKTIEPDGTFTLAPGEAVR